MKKLDILGGQIPFYIGGYNVTKTTFGSIISVIVVVLMVLMTLAFGRDFYQRTNPQLVTSTQTSEKYKKHLVNNKNFTLAVRLEDPWGKPFKNDRFAFVSMAYTTINNTIDQGWVTTSENLIQLKQCTKDDISNIDFAQNNNLDSLLCPDYKILYNFNFDKGYPTRFNITRQSNTIEFGGYWDADFINRISIKVDSCLEGSFNYNFEPCLSDADKEKIFSLENLYLSMYFQQTTSDSSDYDDGIRTDIKNDFFRMDRYFTKQKYIFFVETILNTDYGWILQTSDYLYSLGSKSTFIDIYAPPLVNGKRTQSMIGLVLLYGDRDTIYLKREYSKIQTLAAQVGGILKFFITCGHLIVSKFNLCYMQLSFNDFYSKSIDGSKKEEKVNQLDGISMINLSSNNQIQSSVLNSKFVNNNTINNNKLTKLSSNMFSSTNLRATIMSRGDGNENK